MAIWRDQTLIADPKSLPPFQTVGLIGETSQIERVEKLLGASNLREQADWPPV